MDYLRYQNVWVHKGNNYEYATKSTWTDAGRSQF